MATASPATNRTDHERGGGASAAERWGPTVARAGWAAKGAVYAVTAVLTLQLALGDPSGAPDQQGALRAVADQSFGTVLLVLLVVGLLAYAVGRFLEASVLAAPGLEALDRVRMVGSGLAHGALAVVAIRLLTGDGGGSGGGGGGGGGGQGSTASSVTADVMDAPLGRWVVGLVGLGFVVAAVLEIRAGVRREFMEELETGRMSESTRSNTARLGTAGLVARGITWALIGWFIVQAAVQHDPQEAKGLDQVLRSVADEAWGAVLLLVVAFGFLAYAAYCAVQARYRDVGQG